MSDEALKLTVYFGERDRVDGRLTSDVLMEAYERRGLRAAILLRGTEGFGIKHQLHTQRLLTLSEDLPLVSVAVDAREAIERALPDVTSLLTDGLVTVERARLAAGVDAGPDAAGSVKLTLYLGRHDEVAGTPASRAVVAALHRHGVAGATVLLGVDGILHGERRRARFLSGNEDVPTMIVAIGSAQSIGSALAELEDRLRDPLATVERAVVCKRDGAVLSEPLALTDTDPAGLGVWQKLTVYAGERARAGAHPLYVALLHSLRREGAAGATALRGVWGFSGDHPPHGDRFLAVRRRVPVVVTVIDQPRRARRWWRVIDELTAEAGLVTSERVPAFHAFGPGISRGGLELAELR